MTRPLCSVMKVNLPNSVVPAGMIGALASVALAHVRHIASQRVELGVGEHLNRYPVAAGAGGANVLSAGKAVGDFVVREAHRFLVG
jgi:hypothetical protein